MSLSSSAVSSTSARSPLPRSLAFSRFFCSTPETMPWSSSFSSPPVSSPSVMRWMCFVTAPFFEPVAFAASFSRGAIAALICSAADATTSSSRGASRRSSRIAELRTRSRIFFESSVVI
jgi:hypothetical protein